MSAPPFFLRPAAILAPALLAAVAACSDPFQLPPANLAPTSVTETLWALTGTDISLPSAYDVMLQRVVRTDRTSALDFAFDIRVDSLHDTSAVLLPRGALGLYVDGGLQVTQQLYDSITIAPTSGYQDTAAVAITAGTVVLAASRSQTCNFGFVRPIYAKLHVTTVDLVARTVTFDILVDPNCGYRSLKADSLPPKQ
jgi:hypothetical protein